MQVLLNTDSHTDGRQSMSDYLKAELQDVLGHYGEHLTRVEAHLSDAKDSTKVSGSQIQCSLEARVAGLDPVVVKEAAGTAHQAIHGAIRKLERAVGSHLNRHDPRRKAGHPNFEQDVVDGTPDVAADR